MVSGHGQRHVPGGSRAGQRASEQRDGSRACAMGNDGRFAAVDKHIISSANSDHRREKGPGCTEGGSIGAGSWANIMSGPRGEWSGVESTGVGVGVGGEWGGRVEARFIGSFFVGSLLLHLHGP